VYGCHTRVQNAEFDAYSVDFEQGLKEKASVKFDYS
jgi:hypothetical protein